MFKVLCMRKCSQFTQIYWITISNIQIENKKNELPKKFRKFFSIFINFFYFIFCSCTCVRCACLIWIFLGYEVRIFLIYAKTMFFCFLCRKSECNSLITRCFRQSRWWWDLLFLFFFNLKIRTNLLEALIWGLFIWWFVFTNVAVSMLYYKVQPFGLSMKRLVRCHGQYYFHCITNYIGQKGVYRVTCEINWDAMLRTSMSNRKCHWFKGLYI